MAQLSPPVRRPRPGATPLHGPIERNMTEKTLEKSIHLAEIDLAEPQADQTVAATGSTVPVSESPDSDPRQSRMAEERPGGAWLI